MPQLKNFYAGGEIVKLFTSCVGSEDAERIRQSYANAPLNEVFGNAELMNACFTLFENDLNVSMTASKLYMHRNTLIYSLNKIRSKCGLDLRRFPDAVTFLLLYALGGAKRAGGIPGGISGNISSGISGNKTGNKSGGDNI